MNKKELHKNEVRNAIYLAILSDDLKPFIKIPANYAPDYINDLALNIANDYVHKIFDLNEVIQP